MSCISWVHFLRHPTESHLVFTAALQRIHVVVHPLFLLPGTRTPFLFLDLGERQLTSLPAFVIVLFHSRSRASTLRFLFFDPYHPLSADHRFPSMLGSWLTVFPDTSSFVDISRSLLTFNLSSGSG